jgi:hypothetical protein
MSEELHNLYSSTLIHNGFAGFQRGKVTDRALLIHYSAKTFRSVRHVLSITVFYIRIYIPGRAVSKRRVVFFLGGGGDNTRRG